MPRFPSLQCSAIRWVYVLPLLLLAACSDDDTSDPCGSPSSVRPVFLIAPARGATVSGSTTIEWTNPCQPQTMRIELLRDGGMTLAAVIAAAAPDTGSFAWDTTSAPDGQDYRLRLTPTYASGFVGPPFGNSDDFAIDNTTPAPILGAAEDGQSRMQVTRTSAGQNRRAPRFSNADLAVTKVVPALAPMDVDGDEAGTFLLPGTLACKLGPNNTALGDIDSDGDLDVIIDLASSETLIWINDGTFPDNRLLLGCLAGLKATVRGMEHDGDVNVSRGIEAAWTLAWLEQALEPSTNRADRTPAR